MIEVWQLRMYVGEWHACIISLLPFKITDTAGVTVYRFSKLTILFNVQIYVLFILTLKGLED